MSDRSPWEQLFHEIGEHVLNESRNESAKTESCQDCAMWNRRDRNFGECVMPFAKGLDDDFPSTPDTPFITSDAPSSTRLLTPEQFHCSEFAPLGRRQ